MNSSTVNVSQDVTVPNTASQNKLIGLQPDATPQISREELHFRHIDMRGFRRSDGLYEVEGWVVDQKPTAFTRPGDNQTVPANQPIHDMGVRLVFDSDMVVHDVATFTRSAPYRACPEGGRALQSLKGLRMASGWNREVRSLLRGAASCTHLMELLSPMATVAIQSLGTHRNAHSQDVDSSGVPAKVDSCYAYAAHGELVLRRWPQFYRPPKSDDLT